jgi:hypothetical protein
MTNCIINLHAYRNSSTIFIFLLSWFPVLPATHWGRYSNRIFCIICEPPSYLPFCTIYNFYFIIFFYKSDKAHCFRSIIIPKCNALREIFNNQGKKSDFQMWAYQIHITKKKKKTGAIRILIELKGEVTLTNMYSLHSTTTIVFIHPENERKSPVCPKHIVSQWCNIIRRTNVTSECMLVHTCQNIKYENTGQCKEIHAFSLKKLCYIYPSSNKIYSMYYEVSLVSISIHNEITDQLTQHGFSTMCTHYTGCLHFLSYSDNSSNAVTLYSEVINPLVISVIHISQN